MTTPPSGENYFDYDPFVLDDMPLDVYSEADVERYEAALEPVRHDDAAAADMPPRTRARFGGPVFEPLSAAEVQALAERRAAQAKAEQQAQQAAPDSAEDQQDQRPAGLITEAELEDAIQDAEQRRAYEQRSARPATRGTPANARPVSQPQPVTRPAAPRTTRQAAQDKPKESRSRRSRSAKSRLTPVNQLSSVEREQRARALHETFSRYIVLKDEETRIKKEKDELAAYIKEHVRAGDRAEVDGMVPLVMTQKKRAIDPQDFLETFGLEALLKCVTLNVKQVDELVASGEIDAQEAEALVTMVDGPVALYVRPASDLPRK